ncbi:precorrin-3B synthase [Lichenicola sp.]|uniref:precorrin-3B synthase n=1 Tax=Lichenicola sp. TaxID=2804529 RepID=UPI003B005D5E
MSMIRGWCPSLFEPMASGDGLLLRIKPFASRLTSGAARQVAEAAGRFGNGAIELTNRGNLQLRGFTESSAAVFAREAVDGGLALADPAAERRRNVQVSALEGDDPACDATTLAVARALEALVLADDRLDALPGKFGFAVDGGGSLPLEGVPADITLRSAGGGWHVEAGGATGACTAEDAPSHAHRLAIAALGLPADTRPSRQAGCGAMLFQAAGLAHAAAPALPGGHQVPVGELGHGAFGIGVPPGRLDRTLLLMLAELADRLGDGMLRLTPWRAILLGGLSDEALAAVRHGLAGQLIDPADPRLRSVACIGKAGCVHGSVDAPHDAARLGARLPPGLELHVAGCAKGCAHPGPAPLTLVGRDGRYDLVLDGRAGDPAIRHGLTFVQALELVQQTRPAERAA